MKKPIALIKTRQSRQEREDAKNARIVERLIEMDIKYFSTGFNHQDCMLYGYLSTGNKNLWLTPESV